jgi:hypothetical protein
MVNRDWLRTRVNLLRRSRKRVAHLLGPEPREITNYSYEYHLELSRAWQQCQVEDLFLAIRRAQIVYGADFHGYAQAQRTHLRILRQLSPRPVVLAMEVFKFTDQEFLNSYLIGELSESEFLRKVKWSSRWGFPWEHYRPLVQLAQVNGWPVVGLDCRGQEGDEGLETRDIEAALKIRECLMSEGVEDRVVYVIFGELHLAEKHLPQKVANFCSPAPERVIVYQNAEEIYFELVELGIESNTDVVRLGEDKFCIMSSPPWVQWQSYLMYLENSLDGSLEDDEVVVDHDGSEDLEDVYEIEPVDYTDYVAQYAEIMATDLGHAVNLGELSVHTATTDHVWDCLERDLTSEELALASELMEKDRSFVVPPSNIFYLSRPSVNHASYLAALFIFSQINRLNRCLWNLPQDLTRLIWRESLTFFLSKLINHKRIAVSIADVHRQLATINDSETREILQLVVEQRMNDLLFLEKQERRTLTFTPKKKVAYIEAARQLGAISGERIYRAVRAKKISFEDILRWLSVNLDGNDFEVEYYKFLACLEEFSHYSSKADRI